MIFSLPVFADNIIVENQDKLLHFSGSYVLTHGSYAVCKAVSGKDVPCRIIGSVLAATAGVAKELCDKQSAKEHGGDLAADTAGILGANLMIQISF